MFAIRLSFALALLAGASTAARACPVPEGWTTMQVESAHASTVALKLPATPVQTGEPFAVDILVCSERPTAAGDLKLDATMPAHRHGMNYRPEIEKVDDNMYRGNGMFFHMPGEWQIAVDIAAGDQVERFILKVPAR